MSEAPWNVHPLLCPSVCFFIEGPRPYVKINILFFNFTICISYHMKARLKVVCINQHKMLALSVIFVFIDMCKIVKSCRWKCKFRGTNLLIILIGSFHSSITISMYAPT